MGEGRPRAETQQHHRQDEVQGLRQTRRRTPGHRGDLGGSEKGPTEARPLERLWLSVGKQWRRDARLRSPDGEAQPARRRVEQAQEAFGQLDLVRSCVTRGGSHEVLESTAPVLTAFGVECAYDSFRTITCGRHIHIWALNCSTGSPRNCSGYFSRDVVKAGYEVIPLAERRRSASVARAPPWRVRTSLVRPRRTRPSLARPWRAWPWRAPPSGPLSPPSAPVTPR